MKRKHINYKEMLVRRLGPLLELRVNVKKKKLEESIECFRKLFATFIQDSSMANLIACSKASEILFLHSVYYSRNSESKTNLLVLEARSLIGAMSSLVPISKEQLSPNSVKLIHFARIELVKDLMSALQGGEDNLRRSLDNPLILLFF